MYNLLNNIFLESIQATGPKPLIRKYLQLEDSELRAGEHRFKLGEFSSVQLTASGKASVEMAGAVKQVLGDRLGRGLAITSYDDSGDYAGFKIVKASHPVPDESSLDAGRELVDFFKNVPPDSLLINCLSGGTSSLLTLPGEEISIEDLNRCYELLNNSGATIFEMNTVRKHLSRVKGGQLLNYLDPTVTLLELVISDVPGDNLEIIGSGPTTPDTSTFQDTYHLLLEYELWETFPDSARSHIEKGIDGIVPETVKPGEDPLASHIQLIIGSAREVGEEATRLLGKQGYQVKLSDEAYNKDVREVASMIASDINALRSNLSSPVALVYYGESTVNVTGDGKGGRNQELALRGALEIEGYEDIAWLSAGTDGIDGPTDAAGAIVTGDTIAIAKEKGLDPRQYLENNDAYHFHEQLGTLLKTGPTGNNLMDLVMVVIS